MSATVKEILKPSKNRKTNRIKRMSQMSHSRTE